jgi:hypothetical protein
VLVLPGDDASDLARQLSKSMAAKLQEPVTIGAAGPISDPVDLPSAFAEATACKNALVALGRAGLDHSLRRQVQVCVPRS